MKSASLQALRTAAAVRRDSAQLVSGRGGGGSGGEHHRFRPDVEGLRAVAIVLVVLYHVHAGLAPGGYVGVDVFFVISGFLITGQLVRELRTDGRISFLAFYARRARRILPAAMLTVIVTAVASALLLNPLAAKRALDDLPSAIYFGANVHLAAQGADYFNAGLSPSPVQHFWSLAVEEQFYIVWPLLLVVSSLVWLRVRRRSRGKRAQRPVIGAVDRRPCHPRRHFSDGLDPTDGDFSFVGVFLDRHPGMGAGGGSCGRAGITTRGSYRPPAGDPAQLGGAQLYRARGRVVLRYHLVPW